MTNSKIWFFLVFLLIFLFHASFSFCSEIQNGDFNEIKLPIKPLFAAIPSGEDLWFAVASKRDVCIVQFFGDDSQYKINCINYNQDIKDIFIRYIKQNQYLSVLTSDRIETLESITFDKLKTIPLPKSTTSVNSYVLHEDVDGDLEDDIFICVNDKIYYYISSFQQQFLQSFVVDVVSEAKSDPFASELPISDCNERYWHVRFSNSKKIKIIPVPHREGAPAAIAVISSDNVSPEKINFIELKKNIAPKVVRISNDQFESIAGGVFTLNFLKDDYSNKLDILVGRFSPSLSQPGQIFPEIKYSILANSKGFEYLPSLSATKSIYLPNFPYFTSSLGTKFRLAAIDSPLAMGSKEAFSDLLSKNKVSFRLMFCSYDSNKDKFITYAFPWLFEYAMPKDPLTAQLNLYPLSLDAEGNPSILYNPTAGKWTVFISKLLDGQLKITKTINLDIPSDFNFFSSINTDKYRKTSSLSWINDAKTSILTTKIKQ